MQLSITLEKTPLPARDSLVYRHHANHPQHPRFSKNPKSPFAQNLIFQKSAQTKTSTAQTIVAQLRFLQME